MNKRKFIIFFIAGALLYSFVLIVAVKLFSKPNENPGNISNPNNSTENEKIEYDYLIIGDKSLWGYTSGYWQDLDKKNISDDLLKVYINNSYYGDYKLKFVNTWNLFNSSGDYVSYNGELIAHSSELNVTIKPFVLQNVTIQEINEINQILNQKLTLDDLSNSEVVSVDLDNNNVIDKIVNVSNLDAIETQEEYFNLCYVILNNEVKVIINEIIEEKDILTEPIYNIIKILNINSETMDSIVIQEGYFSERGETTNQLFQYRNNNYSNVIR